MPASGRLRLSPFVPLQTLCDMGRAAAMQRMPTMEMVERTHTAEQKRLLDFEAVPRLSDGFQGYRGHWAYMTSTTTACPSHVMADSTQSGAARSLSVQG